MDHSSSAQYYQQQPPSQQQLYEPQSSSSSQMQPYQYDYSSNQSYDYTYNQYYYHHHDPYSSYYTHHDYNSAYSYHSVSTTNQPQQGEESSIYPPGVPPPPQHINSTHSADAGPLPPPAWPHYQEPGALVMVEGPVDPPKVVSSASLNYVMAGDMQQPLPKQRQKIAPVARQVVQSSHASTSGAVRKAVKVQGHSAKVRPPRPSAGCELCRVDCNSLEILEQHRNGKKHKKMLQKLNKFVVGGQSEQTSAPESKPEIHDHLQKGEGSQGDPLPPENLPSQAVTEEKEVETVQQKVEEAENKEESGRKVQNSNVEHRVCKLKRKAKGGKGGKWMKSSDGSKRLVEPPKPKQVVPLICELCNVKCESNVVFQSHLTGKKHLTNLKRFQEQQAMIGQAALQALYPALQALLPALQELCQGDINTLISQLQQQGALNPQNSFAQSAPPRVLQGQASEAAPATLSALPQSSTFSHEQQDFGVEGSRATGGSWNDATMEGKSHEQSNPSPGPNSNVGCLEMRTGESVE